MARRRPSTFPPWLRRPLPSGGTAGRVKKLLSDLDLHTVCQGALCPNQSLCFSEGTATFLILGVFVLPPAIAVGFVFPFLLRG